VEGKVMISDFRYFDIQFDDEAIILRLANPNYFNTDDYSDLQEELLCFVKEVRPALLVVDLGNVTYCSTALIGGLIQMRSRMAKYGGGLRLSRPSFETREILHSLRLERTVFDLYETTGAALVDC
jgi:anti-anti-sigma regulatory factor